MSTLVLITGTGRSGTSTMSGTLHHLGLDVPGPHLGANESNPKGFFESRWAVSWHKEIAKAAGIHEFDSRPTAFERAQSVITEERRRRLVAFLEKHPAGTGAADQLVVKDPRSVWTQAVWREAAAEVGRDTVYVSMLRHPAEVVGSRATYYANPDDAEQRHRYEIFNVARWINSSLISERETRGLPRGFVRYPDLLSDWRPVLRGLGEDLGLRYDADPADGVPSPVDEFIDPDLRRHRVTWDDLDIPAALRDLAQEVWDVLDGLADAHGRDDAASARMDALAADYARVFSDAAAISHDAMEEARAEAHRAGAQAARERAARSAAPSPTVADAGGRELLSALRLRVVRRLRHVRG